MINDVNSDMNSSDDDDDDTNTATQTSPIFQ